MSEMPSIHVCRPRCSPLRRWLRPLRVPGRFLSTPAIFGLWLLLSGLTAFLPPVYLSHRISGDLLAWVGEAHEVGRMVVDRWTRPVPLTEYPTDPFVFAWVDPESGETWIRRGAGLARPESGESTRLLRWARKAKASGQTTWIPPVQDHPEAQDETILGLETGRWWEFKRWTPTSGPEVAFVDSLLAGTPRFKFNLIRYERDPLIGRQNAMNAKRPAPSARPVFYSSFPDLSLAFGDPWVVAMTETPTQKTILEHRIRTWKGMAWSVHLLFVLASGLGCLLHLHIRRKDRLRADQLAFLAHSLKTPLTILKLRCDTIRNASLPKEVQDTQVARIGDEVDKLVRVIETGLERVRPETGRPAPDRIDGGFFIRIKDQLDPIFAGEGRVLCLDVENTAFSAPARSLQPALNTLLENALAHGKGTVWIQARSRGNCFEIKICDEGEGISGEKIAELAAAGDPSRGQLVPALGHGVGIFLLRQVAEHEGWGLRFDSNGAGGFAAVLEIPA